MIHNVRVAAILLVAVLAGCGENVYDPSDPGFANPPRNIEGIAWDGSSVALQWKSPGDIPDSVIAGYRIKYNGIEDSVPRVPTKYILRNLPQGMTAFGLLTVLKNGVVSQPIMFQWAPAARFDSQPVIIYEAGGPSLILPVGLHIGSRTTDPYAIVLQSGVQPVLHLILFGAGAQPLKLQSASYVIQNGLITLFSPTSHASPDLDYFLSSYPSTYNTDETPVFDNTIYYVRFRGDGGEYNYARLHVRVTPGAAYPNRSVEIRVSLQRLGELQLALLGKQDGPPTLAGLLPLFGRVAGMRN